MSYKTDVDNVLRKEHLWNDLVMDEIVQVDNW